MARRTNRHTYWRDTLAPPAAIVPRPRHPADVGPTVAGQYSDFTVLLDGPAKEPGLHFEDYAQGLAELIRDSRAAFAVAIFGGWGTGKTTLMRRIEALLAGDQSVDQVVTVWFSAWRYEKEAHLIVPLLDVLREALEERADRIGDRGWRRRRRKRSGPARMRSDDSSWARDAASKVARAGQAFLAGLTVTVSLPGVQLGYSPAQLIEDIKAGKESPGPLSYYHAGFSLLNDAIADLSAGGTRRLVIFVDDLDRCLAQSALEVLESMKVFFDVAGCVFVAGLDHSIVDRAVASKFSAAADMAAAPAGASYVGKIFQVPFALPQIDGSQLPSYLSAVSDHSGFGDEQRADFDRTVRPHLVWCLQDAEQINPREIKRLINSYVVQLKMLSPQLGGELDHDVVLALLCMNFRPDWREIYRQLAADPPHFQSIVVDAREDDEWRPSVWLSGRQVPLPRRFAEYLDGYASRLLDVPDLRVYVSAAEATWTIDPHVLEARTGVSRLFGFVDDVVDGRLSRQDATWRMQLELDRLSELLHSLSGLIGRPDELRQHALGAVSRVAELIREITRPADEAPGESREPGESAETWAANVREPLMVLATSLGELYRSVSVGP